MTPPRDAPFHHLKITTGGRVGQGTVEMDGEEIGPGLLGVDVCLHVRELNTATLELSAPTFEVDGEFQIILPEETQALLKRLGWTPPS